MRTKILNTCESNVHMESGLLPVRFLGKGEVRDFLFEQIHADDSWYIYRVTNYGCEWYEVFMRRRIYSTGKEIYPKAKVFGFTAWCATDLKRAYAIIAGNSKKRGGLKRRRSPLGIRSGQKLEKRAVKTASN